MSPRNFDGDLILGVGDLGWSVGIGLLSALPVMVVSDLGWSLWFVVPVALPIGFVQGQLLRRYSRRLEARRPNRSGRPGAGADR